MTGDSIPEDRSYKLFIDGKSIDASSGEVIPVIDPAIDDTFATVSAGSKADIDRATEAAQRVQAEWYQTPPAERGRALRKAADKIREQRDELAEAITRENGKPFSQAQTEVDVAARYFEYYAGAADKVHGKTIPIGAEHVDYTIREPLGVIAHIVPWNFPLSLFARSVAPALAVGNTSVVKPAEQTPISSIILGKLITEAGLPDGALNIVPGYGTEAGATLVSHSNVDSVAFTGSVATGKEVAATAAREFKPVHIEAGGKNPNVVFPDADIDQALEQTLISIFTRNAGQVCSAGDRLLVHEDIHDTFLNQLISRVESLSIGAGLEDPDIGALVSKNQYEKVINYLEIGEQEVGKPVVGGISKIRNDEDGYFVPPTIFDTVDPDARIAQEEIFGPVLTITPFKTEREAINIANRTEYGLVAGVFTNDLKRAHRFARDVVAGQVYVNEWFAGGVETPFGGYRQSGFGREKGMEAIQQFTETKNVCLHIEE